MSQPRLALFLLGAPQVEREGKPVEIVRRKAMALLAYLAVTGESHRREALMTLLWPEYDQARARADLRRTLSVLNTTLGGEWLQTDGELVNLNRRADFWLDIEQFEYHLATCQSHGHPPDEVCPACLPPLTEAVQLYRGEFLAGFSLRDSANFDEWQFFQTERLGRELAQALERLICCHDEWGELDAALTYAHHWVELDPLHEPAQRQLMQLYARSGQRAAALRQYHRCIEILAQELSVPPQQETTVLYERIQAGELSRGAGKQGSMVVWENFAPTPPHPAPLHELPDQPTPFIGRRAELTELAKRLADPACRLLTLIGPGGIGKTRLALETAARASSGEAFPDGVHFIPLTRVSRAEFLVSAIGHALKLSFYSPEGFDENPKAQLFNYLHQRKILLVLDNFEHLLSGTDLLTELLQIAPAVKLLVTSQERLNLQAEWVMEIQGMRVPEEDEVDRLEAYSAVRLFLQNARRVQADFVLTEVDKPYVIRICRLVGGMPLGIQLASAWVRLLSCQEIVQEIEHNLDFLATSLRDVPERHRSLRVVFAHSWNLLSEQEQQAYCQLSVFQGGFRRAAAEQVAGASLAILSGLADKSFLHRSPAGRYEIHEVLRQYAAEKLHEMPRAEAEAQACHATYHAAFLQNRAEALKGVKQKEVVAEIETEFENVRAAWRWAIAKGELRVIEQSLESLYRFYDMRGWMPEGEAAFERAVVGLTGQVHDETNRLILGKVMARQGALCTRLGLPDKAGQLLQKSLNIFRRANVPEETAFALNYLGTVAHLGGDYEHARQLWQESLALYRQLGDRWGMAWSLSVLGHLLGELGAYRAARQHLQESLVIQQEIGNRRGLAGALNNLGHVLYLLGEYAEARVLLQEGLAMRRELGFRRGIAISLNHLGDVALALEDVAAAKQSFYEALKTAMDLRATPLALDSLVGLATCLAQEGDTRQAIELLRFPFYHAASGQETKDKVQRLLTDLGSQSPPGLSTMAQAVAGRNPRDFEAVVRTLLAEWEA
jgi:predicted ATPase/DNA-binding SARP family transcriptional activator